MLLVRSCDRQCSPYVRTVRANNSCCVNDINNTFETSLRQNVPNLSTRVTNGGGCAEQTRKRHLEVEGDGQRVGMWGLGSSRPPVTCRERMRVSMIGLASADEHVRVEPSARTSMHETPTARRPTRQALAATASQLIIALQNT